MSPEEALADAIKRNSPASTVKPVVPRTRMPHAYSSHVARPDAPFVSRAIGRVDADLKGNGLTMARSSGSDALRRATGRAVPPAKNSDPRQAQLTGLCKAVGVKNVGTVVGLIPETATEDVDVVRFLDDLSITCAHLFQDTTKFTDVPMSQVIGKKG